jgi:heptosyltransferase-2
MAMHLAIGLRKPLVLFNNIFNPAEFELYGRGEILAPEKPCTCFFRNRCLEEEPCMPTLRPETVREAVLRQVAAS